MNKFYCHVVERSGWRRDGQYLSVYLHYYGSKGIATMPYSVGQIDWDKFYSMCESPVKAILYLNHDNSEIRDLAKLILTCKEPVEIKSS